MTTIQETATIRNGDTVKKGDTVYFKRYGFEYRGRVDFFFEDGDSLCVTVLTNISAPVNVSAAFCANDECYIK